MGLKEKQKGLIAFSYPESIISEQYRTIRTNIQFSSVNQTLHTLIVTSPSFGEGKSTTVTNLATSMAHQGVKVLVVDADLRKPTLHKTFGFSNTSGLVNILKGEANFDEVVNKTEIEGLEVINSGPVPFNPAELLSSQTFDQFIKSAKEHYDLVIFDSSPILAVTDGRILSNKCEGTILVLKNGKTKVEEALEAKRILGLARANCVGVILNNK